MDTVICVAAGLSSRMGTFKPLLPLGDSTIIRTLIARYRACGIAQIVLVTGKNAELLENHVRDLGVLCRRNTRFAESDMFESVRIGIRAFLENGAPPTEGAEERIFLTPGDIPLVSANTIRALLDASGDICIPTANGVQGHPLRLSRQALEPILRYEGPGGLRGALDALGAHGWQISEIPVDDPGILLDADTPDDYERLKQLLR